MLLFGKLVDETQMGNPLDHAVRDTASKFSIFLPLRAIYFRSYRYETPCKRLKLGLALRLLSPSSYLQQTEDLAGNSKPIGTGCLTSI